MRIVSGLYGGRLIETPQGRNIRPTSDKVRGAIFNMLQARDAVVGARVLDVFCGTGALGLEALSRGAESCVFIDHDRKSLDLSRRNAAALKVEQKVQFILCDAMKIGQRPQEILAATLLFLDPPYRKNLIEPSLNSLYQGGWIAPGAFIVIEMEKESQFASPAPFAVQSEKIYGETKVILSQAIAPL